MTRSLPAARVLVAALALVLTAAATARADTEPAPSTGSAAPPVPVQRIAGPARADTAAALARAVTDAASVVYLVADDDFADGLAAGVAAAANGGVVLLLARDGVPPATAGYLATAGDAELVVVGGTTRLPPALDEELRTVTGRSVRRIAGADRYATAAELARATRPHADHVWLVSGTTAPDALGAGAAAAATDGALLSTRPDRLDPAARTALEDLAPDTVTVVGGPAAVGPGVLDEVRALLGAEATVRRVGAADRYATSAAVARAAFDAPTAALVTTGRSAVDALAATPLAAAQRAPVVLVPRRCVTPEVDEVLADVDRVVIAGGEVAVSPRVAALSSCAEEIASVTAAELGPSWRPGCPVGPGDLRRVTVDHRTLDGGVEVGHLVVHRSVAADMVTIFDRVFAAGFGLQTVTSVAEFGADDDVAMAANATTAFNCRTVAGTDTWSQHAFGTAVDVNPVQNPYVSAGAVLPPAGAAYTDRSDVRPGMVVAGGPVDRAFADRGWSWGGRWRTVKDYQHFSRSGR